MRRKARKALRHPEKPGLRSVRGRGSAFFELLEGRQLFAAHILGSTTSYTTIQAAVNAASKGAIITVDAGTYAELVTVNKSLTIRGPQAGIDGRSNTRAAANSEAIVNGAVISSKVKSTGFYIHANDVTIDGFTVTGCSTRSKYGAG